MANATSANQVTWSDDSRTRRPQIRFALLSLESAIRIELSTSAHALCTTGGLPGSLPAGADHRRATEARTDAAGDAAVERGGDRASVGQRRGGAEGGGGARRGEVERQAQVAVPPLRLSRESSGWVA